MRKTAFLALILLSGCVATQDYRAPVEIPSTFLETQRSRGNLSGAGVAGPINPSAGNGTPSDPEWSPAEPWRMLGDTTLNRLMDLALEANLDVHAARSRIRSAGSARTEAALDLAPIVTFAAGYNRERLSSVTFPLRTGTFTDQDVWNGGLNATWEIDIFGRQRRNLQARGALVDFAHEDLRDVQVALAAELSRAYFDLRGAQEHLSVLRRNAENQRRTLELTRERLDAGRGTAFDVERAQAQLSLTLSGIPSVEAREFAARYEIAVLVGRPPGTFSNELGRSGDLPGLPPVPLVTDPVELIRRRPDVAGAERRLAAERALVGVAKANYLPRVAIVGSAGYTATSASSLGESGTSRYGIGPVVTWAGFDLGRVKTRVDGARARASEAEARYEQSVLLALEEIETTLARYQAALDRVERIREAAAASERAAELARLRFTQGVADFLQVLDAERMQLETQAQLTRARTEGATTYSELYRALGGEW